MRTPNVYDSNVTFYIYNRSLTEHILSHLIDFHRVACNSCPSFLRVNVSCMLNVLIHVTVYIVIIIMQG